MAYCINSFSSKGSINFLVMNVFNGVDLQIIAISETCYKTKHTNRQVNFKGYRVI
jgi:hypothetical protein